IRGKNKKYNSILKAVSSKASTNIRIIAITNKKIVLATSFSTSYRLKYTFKLF
ncbi:hypothetical protein OIDMADRAFT_167261, partial [Oidiodendron maius Zn]